MRIYAKKPVSINLSRILPYANQELIQPPLANSFLIQFRKCYVISSVSTQDFLFEWSKFALTSWMEIHLMLSVPVDLAPSLCSCVPPLWRHLSAGILFVCAPSPLSSLSVSLSLKAVLFWLCAAYQSTQKGLSLIQLWLLVMEACDGVITC